MKNESNIGLDLFLVVSGAVGLFYFEDKSIWATIGSLAVLMYGLYRTSKLVGSKPEEEENTEE
ncbi:MAG: hypothetical protein RQ735_10890 [Flavobacteriaceae bacterium]|nr:hypothetical protein [Flavobacteriaceae bacterium]